MPFDDQNPTATIKIQERGIILFPADVRVTNAIKKIIRYMEVN